MDDVEAKMKVDDPHEWDFLDERVDKLLNELGPEGCWILSDKLKKAAERDVEDAFDDPVLDLEEPF